MLRPALKRGALLAALFVAMLGTALTFFYLRRFEEERSGGEPVRVLQTVKPVKAGERLREDMLATILVPRAYVEKRAVLEEERSKIVGLPVGHRLDAQQMLLWTDLAIALEERRTLSSLVQPGMRAVTVKAKSGDDKGFALIRPGDRIDVIATMKKDKTPGASADAKTSVVLLQNVLVLAVGADTGSDPDRKKPALRGELVLSLSLNLQETQLLALAVEQDQASITVALRNPDDVRVLENPGELSSSALQSHEERAKVQSIRRATGPVRIEGRAE